MRVSRNRSLALFVGVILAVVGCDTTEPAGPGEIRVVVNSAGEDIILSGLRVSLPAVASRPLDSASAGTTIGGLAAGVHPVTLEGMSANCQVTSANPRSVTVVSNATVIAEFNLVCTRRVGSIRVTTTTVGSDLDPDGYTAAVDGGSHQAVGLNGATTIVGVRQGLHTVTLSGIASNCEIIGAGSPIVNVQMGATSDVAFYIQCVAAGSLEVTVATTGLNLDPDGYSVAAEAVSVNFTGALGVQPNGSVTFTRLRPAADYNVTLQGVSANCDVTGGDARTVAVAAGATTRVTFDVVCEPPRLFAFARNGDIYVMSEDGTGLTRLTTDPAVDGEPAWSSTGRIAFTTRRHSNDTELYVMSENGANAVRITTSAGLDDAPSWSPDGQRLVFRTLRHVNSEIYVANADGSGLIRLTDDVAADDQPAWSSTGKIAFISNRHHASGEIYVMNPDGSNVVRLTHNDSAETSPAWSPDGSMIAFARHVECYYGCSHDIFVMNADGSGARRLATGWVSYQNHTDPSWSPNGRSIAFARQYCGYYYYACSDPTIWRVDVQGPGLRMLAADASDPSWKP